jgi:AraC-like DNA-binding protein
MFYFGYSHTDYTGLLQDYAKAMGTMVSNGDTLIFPEEYATGYHRLRVLPNGLQALLIDYTINQDTFINRVQSTEAFYVLRFEEIQISSSITVHAPDDEFIESAFHRSTAILTSSLFDFGYILRKGTRARAVIIILDADWLAKYLDIPNREEVLLQYLSLKSESFNTQPLDAGYRLLIDEALLECAQPDPLKKLVVQNRIMMLVERFFLKLYQNARTLPSKNNYISSDDMQRLMHIEALLVKDFSMPAPTITALARHAMMSETKLKNLFKKIYGTGLYAYFQKNRMMKARLLLVSKKYSIKEVGIQLGFQNLSNFTIAFKKEFNMLPSEM